MKNILKKALICVMVGGAASLTGCTDLDETLYDVLSEDNVDLTQDRDLSQLLGGAITNYRYLITDWGGQWTLSCISADEMMIPARVEIGWGDTFIPMHKHTWAYSNNWLDGVWTFCYQGISYCNMILDAMGEETDDNRELMSHVRFYRALFYWHLLDNFGNVPIQTTYATEAGFLPEQTGVESVYTFVTSELEDIKYKIGTEKHFGYGNQYVVSTLLAKVYLNRNALLGTTGNEGYTAALAELNEVINSGEYELAPKYKDNFRENIQECKEVIFAVPQDRTHTSNWIMLTFAMPDAVMLNAYNCSAGGNSGHCAIPQFCKTYDVDDQRSTDTWAQGTVHKYVENLDGTYVQNPADGDPVQFVMHNWDGTTNCNFNIECHSIDTPGCYAQEGWRIHKYEMIYGTDDACTATDIAIFRYADVLLMKAECLLRLGQDEMTAADLVTRVRQRNFSANPSKATRTVADLKGGSCYQYGHDEYQTAEEASVGCMDWSNHIYTYEGGDDIELGGLLDELGWEFAGEMHRRQDLRRFKMADGRNVWNGKSWFCKDATTETHWDFFPIPESAIKSNIKLVQNPGY